MVVLVCRGKVPVVCSHQQKGFDEMPMRPSPVVFGFPCVVVLLVSVVRQGEVGDDLNIWRNTKSLGACL